jgi:hypothetical protein
MIDTIDLPKVSTRNLGRNRDLDRNQALHIPLFQAGLSSKVVLRME